MTFEEVFLLGVGILFIIEGSAKVLKLFLIAKNEKTQNKGIRKDFWNKYVVPYGGQPRTN